MGHDDNNTSHDLHLTETERVVCLIADNLEQWIAEANKRHNPSNFVTGTFLNGYHEPLLANTEHGDD